MRIVSNNSEADLATARAREEAEWAIIELTANLLRIVRGAGKPYELGRQIVRVDQAMRDHWEADRTWPFHEMANAIALEPMFDKMSGWSEESREMAYAQRKVVAGALQTVASELLGQRTQQRAGESEMFDGVNAIEDIRADDRRKRAALSASERKAAGAAAVAAARARIAAKKSKSRTKKT